MRRDVFFSISLVAVIDFLNASTLPLDFQPTGQDLQFVNLGPEVQNRPLPCFGESPDSSIVNKRQETTNCIGGNCGANDNVVPESSITKNQPVKWNDLFDNREESPELAVNLDSGSHDNMFSDGNKDWNNAIAYMPFNDAITNIPSSAPNEHNTVDQTEPDIFRGADGALNDAFEIAAKKAPQTTPKEPPPFVNQDPTTGYVVIWASVEYVSILMNSTGSPSRTHVLCHQMTSPTFIWSAWWSSSLRRSIGTLRPSWSPNTCPW